MINKFQAQLFDEILARFPKRSAAVDALSALLGVQKDAIYRRLRGDTLLMPEEIALLTRHYQISLDALVYKDADRVYFSFSPFSRTINNVGDYLNGILDDLQRVKQLPDVKIFYASFEIPFFYYAYFPELISFKLFIWGKTVWELDYLKDRLFDLDVISYPNEKISEQILKTFTQLDTVEIWSSNICDNTLSQIEFFANSGGFKNPEVAYLLCDKVKALVEQWRKMAELGAKYPLDNFAPELARGSFSLHQQEMLITSNTILVSSPAAKVLFPIISNPNYLRTTDQRMCDYQEEWFRKAISKSTSLSTQNQKSRDAFFNIMLRKINGTRRRIETVLEEF
jgi:hypothetical protein